MLFEASNSTEFSNILKNHLVEVLSNCQQIYKHLVKVLPREEKHVSVGIVEINYSRGWSEKLSFWGKQKLIQLRFVYYFKLFWGKEELTTKPENIFLLRTIIMSSSSRLLHFHFIKKPNLFSDIFYECDYKEMTKHIFRFLKEKLLYIDFLIWPLFFSLTCSFFSTQLVFNRGKVQNNFLLWFPFKIYNLDWIKYPDKADATFRTKLFLKVIQKLGLE